MDRVIQQRFLDAFVFGQDPSMLNGKIERKHAMKMRGCK